MCNGAYAITIRDKTTSKLMGYALVHENQDPSIGGDFLNIIGVDPAQAGKSFNRALIFKTLQRAKESGKNKVSFFADRSEAGLCEAVGVELGENVWVPGEKLAEDGDRIEAAFDLTNVEADKLQALFTSEISDPKASSAGIGSKATIATMDGKDTVTYAGTDAFTTEDIIATLENDLVHKLSPLTSTGIKASLSGEVKPARIPFDILRAVGAAPVAVLDEAVQALRGVEPYRTDQVSVVRIRADVILNNADTVASLNAMDARRLNTVYSVYGDGSAEATRKLKDAGLTVKSLNAIEEESPISGIIVITYGNEELEGYRGVRYVRIEGAKISLHTALMIAFADDVKELIYSIENITDDQKDALYGKFNISVNTIRIKRLKKDEEELIRKTVLQNA